MTQVIETQCCIADEGAAGSMLGYLLVRAGVDVIVVEKHADFADHAKAYPDFNLLTETEVKDLIVDGTEVVGVKATSKGNEIEARARQIIGADGRVSTVRSAADLPIDDLGAPMDVLWFRLSRQPSDTEQTQGQSDTGRIFIMLNRGDYWQCAFFIPKGMNKGVRDAGLEKFRESPRPLLPFATTRADQIATWEQVC
jgi:2-polyprenyl-6-methoxyphenol hydroxylase-like FAD-dependent oxidoreductase